MSRDNGQATRAERKEEKSIQRAARRVTRQPDLAVHHSCNRKARRCATICNVSTCYRRDPKPQEPALMRLTTITRSQRVVQPRAALAFFWDWHGSSGAGRPISSAQRVRRNGTNGNETKRFREQLIRPLAAVARICSGLQGFQFSNRFGAACMSGSAGHSGTSSPSGGA